MRFFVMKIFLTRENVENQKRGDEVENFNCVNKLTCMQNFPVQFRC